MCNMQWVPGGVPVGMCGPALSANDAYGGMQPRHHARFDVPLSYGTAFGHEGGFYHGASHGAHVIGPMYGSMNPCWPPHVMGQASSYLMLLDILILHML